MIIYLVENLINGKKYVGKDSKNNPEYLGSGKYLKRALKKYGRENFKKTVLEVCFSLEELNEKELYWLKKLGCVQNPRYYNILDTPTPIQKKHLTQRHRSNISKALKGRTISLETRTKISQNKKGIKRKPLSPEIRNKISKAHRGKKLTAEHRKKISEKKKGIPRSPHSFETRKKISAKQKKKPVYQLDLDFRIVAEYPTVSSVAKAGFNRIAVQNVLKGRCKKSGGFYWSYKLT